MTRGIVFTLNDKTVELDAAQGEAPLLWVLRDRFKLTGTKYGCGHGGCGACTVRLDGEAVASCMTPARDVAGKSVMTIEGLAKPDHPVIRAWLAEQVPQCGYCQPGMIMAASALLAAHPQPSDREIDEALAHVLCRCGTYQRAREAIHRAARGDWQGARFPEAKLSEPMAQVVAAIRFNPWVKIAPDSRVVVILGRSEMGQGVSTALPMLIAEELEVPLEQVAVEFAPADHVYDNPVIHMQITVGSLSVQTSWEPLRRAGAEVRERLITAAALRWNVDAAECAADNGTIIHRPSGRALRYGEIAEQASQLPPPSSPRLKPIEEFRLLGKATPRLDLSDHVAGRTIFGTDIKLPGLRAATVRLAPHFGAEPERIEAAKASAIHGVRAVVTIREGVAVVADDFHAAMRGREALDVTWRGGIEHLSSADIAKTFAAAAIREGAVGRDEGSTEKALTTAPRKIEAAYETPYLAHAPIEPMNCTARLADSRCEIWVPTQSQTLAQQAAARAAGLPPEAVEVHSTFLGGGFGRRSVPDVVAQAVEIARRVREPVQLLWTRDEDMRHDRYRPASLAVLRAGLDPKGQPLAWFHRVVGPELANEGVNIPYDIPNLRTEYVAEDPGVPTGYWRSVGSSQNAFAIESFIDELAHAAKADPVAYRLGLLGKSPRHRAVLEYAAEKAGWGRPGPGGLARGVAVYYAHGGWAAQIAEIAVEGKLIAVKRVVCAVDCGFIVNPDTVKAQIEGAVAFGLTAALKAEITIEEGHAVQRGFRDYPLLTMAEMPQVEVHLIASRERPTGAGECGVPPIAPAVANAVFTATGQRIRRLPLHLA